MAFHQGFFPKGQCTCDQQCTTPGTTDCTCIWTAHDGQCRCDCLHPTPLPARDQAEPRLPLDTRIAIDTRGNVTRARLGELLAFVTGQKLLIPATGASEKLYLKESDTTFAEVVERVGLIVDASK